jgi:hypothetical protein
MSIDTLIRESRQDVLYGKDDFVDEIVREYYQDALLETSQDPEEAAAVAVEAFLYDLAYGRAANLWRNKSQRDLTALLQDPAVLEYSFARLEEPPRSIKHAVTDVVGMLLFDALNWDRTLGLESAVLSKVGFRG